MRDIGVAQDYASWFGVLIVRGIEHNFAKDPAFPI